jgi:hypothetical protein
MSASSHSTKFAVSAALDTMVENSGLRWAAIILYEKVQSLALLASCDSK